MSRTMVVRKEILVLQFKKDRLSITYVPKTDVETRQNERLFTVVPAFRIFEQAVFWRFFTQQNLLKSQLSEPEFLSKRWF